MTRSTRLFVAAGLLVALVVAGVLSQYASSQPDGLEKVSADQGLSAKERGHDLDDSPLAGYGVEGVDDARLSGGLAGVVGVVLTFALGGGLFLAVRRRASGTEEG